MHMFHWARFSSDTQIVSLICGLVRCIYALWNFYYIYGMLGVDAARFQLSSNFRGGRPPAWCCKACIPYFRLDIVFPFPSSVFAYGQDWIGRP